MKKCFTLLFSVFASIGFADEYTSLTPSHILMDIYNELSNEISNLKEWYYNFVDKSELANYVPISGGTTTLFRAESLYSKYSHIDELEIGTLLTMGSWDWLNVNGVTLTAYGDSRYLYRDGFTNTVKKIVNSMDIKSGGVSQEELLPFGSNITHAVMNAVVTNNLPSLTWDNTLNVAWRKVADNGRFYEVAYTNVEILVTGELK